VTGQRELLEEALRELRRQKARIAELEQASRGQPAPPATPVAIVGMACRLPGGLDDPEALWRFLRDGRTAVAPAPTDRWPADDVAEPVPPGAFLDDPFGFDAPFFQVSPREARLLDPQQRLLLEVAHQAFEHAGIAPSSLHGSDTGVFVGQSTDDWLVQIARHLPSAAIDGSLGPGANACGTAGRVSFTFGLHGPSLVVNTACSSALVALHLACQSLLRGECAQALVLGVNLMLSPVTTATFRRAGMLAADGRSKAFAATADGYGRGEGAMALLLALPTTARQRGLTSWAEVLGSAINQDGATASLTVPNGEAQQRVMRDALQAARVAPADVACVETHGTGTLLGDPIEARALANVFAERRAPDAPLWIASAKCNLGHLEAGAGLLGVLKMALQLHHRELAPHLLLGEPNPHLPWDRLPLRMPAAAMPWPSGARPLGGVSAFSFTGTNAHVVLGAATAATERPRAAAALAPLLLPLSARTPAALRALAISWADAIDAAPSTALTDVVATAVRGRSLFRQRLVALADDPTRLAARLRRLARGEAANGAWAGTARDDRPAAPTFDVDTPPAAIAAAFLAGHRVPWDVWLPRDAQVVPMPTYAFQRRPFRAPTAADEVHSAATAAPDVRHRIAATPPNARPALVLAHVAAVAAAVLQIDASEFDADEPLADLGFDSIRAAELAARLQEDLGVEVPLAALLDGGSAHSLAAALTTLLAT